MYIWLQTVVAYFCCDKLYLEPKTSSPKYFPLLQLDTEYRKKWDALVIKLEVVERDVNTGSEVVHWATHFPVSCHRKETFIEPVLS